METLSDVLAAGASLRGSCAGCERVKTIDPTKLRLPGGCTISEVAAKLKCRECDQNTVTLTVVPRPATDEEVMADPAVKALTDGFPDAKVTISDRKEDQ